MIFLRGLWVLMFAMVVTYAMVGYIQRIPGRAQLAAQQFSSQSSQSAAPDASSSKTQSADFQKSYESRTAQGPDSPVAPTVPMSSDDERGLAKILAIVSSVMVLAGYFLQKHLCTFDRLKKRAQVLVLAMDKVGAFTQDDALEAVARASLLHFAGGWALVVGAALNGFALSQTLKEPSVYLPFALGSLIFLVILRPQIAQLESVARQLRQEII